MLARGERTAGAAIDKYLKTLRVMAKTHSHVIGGTLVAEAGRDWGVQGKMRGIGKSQRQLAGGIGPFLRTVRHRHQIGGGQVTAPVGGIRRGRDRRRIGGPHRRSRPCGSDQVWIVRLAQRGQEAGVESGQGHEEPLRQPQRQVAAHFGQALQGRGAREGWLPGVSGCCKVADTQPGIVVAGTDDPVEIDLD